MILRTLLAVVVVALGVIVGFFFVGSKVEALFTTRTRATAAILEQIRRVEVLRLHTGETTRMVVVHLEEWNPIVGGQEGVMFAPVKFEYGVDLGTLTEADIRVRDDVVFVRMPALQLFDVKPDEERAKLVAKRGAGIAIWETLVLGTDLRDRLRKELHAKARDAAKGEDLSGERESARRRLEALLTMLSGSKSVRL